MSSAAEFFGVIGFVTLGALAVGASIQSEANASPTQTMPKVEFFSATFKDVPGAPIDAPVKVVVQDEDIPIQSSDHFYLAATMWGEARGEGRVGMGYVGHVIMNRVAAEYRGENISEVSTADRQFSCWNSSDPNKEKLTMEYLEHSTGNERAAWIQAKALAWYIMNGSADYTNGALHYHTNAVDPYWNASYKVVATQGNHVFYR